MNWCKGHCGIIAWVAMVLLVTGVIALGQAQARHDAQAFADEAAARVAGSCEQRREARESLRSVLIDFVLKQPDPADPSKLIDRPDSPALQRVRFYISPDGPLAPITCPEKENP